MLDLYFRTPHTIAFMRSGITAPHVDGFAKALHDDGYMRLPGQGMLHAAHHVGEWCARRRMHLDEFDEGALARFDKHLPGCRCTKSTRRPHRGLGEHLTGARRFLLHLRRSGVTPWAPTPARPPAVVEYAAWMRDQRGLADATVVARLPVVEALLSAVGDDTTRLDAASVRRFVLKSVAAHAPRMPSHVTTPVRGFLRYLVAHGRCPAALLGAVPTIPSWHHARLPQYLAAADVERLILGANRDGPAAARDLAVLLLLARLGVRSGDVRELRIGDLDWKHGRVRLIGKGRRETHLPLPQDVGDAILTYLAQRPAASTDHVFLRSRAPYRALTSTGVGHVVRSAFARSGVSAPSRGARVLRHSLATRMLRGGATLDVIGAVLRHRDINTTAIYSKVDVEHLRQIAQPWPGTEVPSC